VALYVLGEFVLPWGLGPVTDIAIKVYQAFFGDHIMKSAMPLFYPDLGEWRQQARGFVISVICKACLST
jgi:hypothetical protein